MSDIGAGERSWHLRGAWRVWLWGSVLVAVFLGLAGAGLLVVAIVIAVVGRAPGALIVVLPGALLLGVATVMTWQLRHTATTVTTSDSGALIVHGLANTLHTGSQRVQRVQPSALVSPPHTPTVVTTADGWFYLIRSRQEKEDIIAVIRKAHPGLHVEI